MTAIRYGELNGVKWRSLTSINQMRSALANRKFNQYQRHGITLTLPEIITKLGFIATDDFINCPASSYEVRIYYKSRAIYFNNNRMR